MKAAAQADRTSRKNNCCRDNGYGLSAIHGADAKSKPCNSQYCGSYHKTAEAVFVNKRADGKVDGRVMKLIKVSAPSCEESRTGAQRVNIIGRKFVIAAIVIFDIRTIACRYDVPRTFDVQLKSTPVSMLLNNQSKICKVLSNGKDSLSSKSINRCARFHCIVDRKPICSDISVISVS